MHSPHFHGLSQKKKETEETTSTFLINKKRVYNEFKI